MWASAAPRRCWCATPMGFLCRCCPPFTGERHITPWLHILGKVVPSPPYVEVALLRSGDSLRQVRVQVVVLPPPHMWPPRPVQLKLPLRPSRQWPLCCPDFLTHLDPPAGGRWGCAGGCRSTPSCISCRRRTLQSTGSWWTSSGTPRTGLSTCWWVPALRGLAGSRTVVSWPRQWAPKLCPPPYTLGRGGGSRRSAARRVVPPLDPGAECAAHYNMIQCIADYVAEYTQSIPPLDL